MAYSIYMERGPLYQQEILTSSIVSNSLVIQDRCDTAFATTKFKAFLTGTKYKYNVSPFTIFHIRQSDDIMDVFVGKSTCNKYFNETNTYVHDFELMEGTAILSCFIVGTKYFSTSGTNKQDKQKINVLCSLMEEKYGWDFTIIDGYSDMTSEIEYSYGAGTTMFDILSDIADHYNKRVVVSEIYASSKEIVIKFVDLNISTSLGLNNNLITSSQYSQNAERYCKYLETEASNVVDRTTITHVRNLTCKSGTIALKWSNARIYTPSAIETIDDIGIQNHKFSAKFVLKDAATYIDRDHDLQQINELLGRNPIIQDAYDSYIYKFMSHDEYLELWLYKELSTSNDMTIVTWEGGSSHTNSTFYFYADTSIKERVLPKEKWDLLSPLNQAKKAVYTPGTNYIENLSSDYKSDLWNVILLNSYTGDISNYVGLTPNGYMSVIQLSSGKTLKITYNSIATNDGLISRLYYADYIAITNPLLIDEKENINNLDNQKFDFSQTYNNSSSLIDFDKITKNMNITNDYTGREELTLEYDITDSNIPKSRYKLTYDNIQWYVSSAITTFAIGKTTTVLNLVRNYNKKAESVEVETQYKATKNPLNMVVTRPLEWHIDSDGSIATDDIGAYYLMLEFTHANGNTTTLFKQATVQCSDTTIVLYYESDDQYSFCDYIGNENFNAELLASTYREEYAPYVDSNNETKYISASIVTLPDLEFSDAKNLPYYDGDYEIVYDLGQKLVYKDARERLTFTIKITL